MRKFISFLMLFCVCTGIAWAAPTDLPTLTVDENNPVWYTIKNTRSGKFMNYAGDETKMTQVSTLSAGSFFYFTAADVKTVEGYTAVKIHNGATSNVLNNNDSWNETGAVWYLHEDAYTKVDEVLSPAGLHIIKNTAKLDGWEALNDGGSTIALYYSDDAGSIFIFEPVTNFETAMSNAVVADFNNAKTNAKEELAALAKISAVYPALTSETTQIDNITLTENKPASLFAAVNQIQEIITTYKKYANGKSVIFSNNGNSGRTGLKLTANTSNNKIYGTTSEGDETIWTIKSQTDGTFKLYNFVTNKYFGDLSNEDDKTSLTDESNAPCYTFKVADVDKVAIVSGDKMVHQKAYWTPNYFVVNWNDFNDAASLWSIEDVEIVITRENYDAAVASKANLPFAIQEAYGLVTDAAKYTSNAKESAEGSYEGLLDNTYNDPSYFHSSYNNAIGAYHYLQAELSESCESFYFYYKKRQGNNDNRPTEIEIQGSTDGQAFTTITTINSGLPTENTITDYMSEMVSATENVKYLRFVVKNTNTPGSKDGTDGHPFFTFSEFYILPATTDVTSLVDAYHEYSTSSITSSAINEAATALVNAETTLSLSNIKKEIAAMLSANATNHAEAPELGQYTTAGYNALSTAYNDANATQETLENAIATFEASKNIPVYFITSAHDGYAAGSAILYDGTTWKWANANIYNRQMWMTIPAYTQEDVPTVNAFDANGTFYEICDYTTGKVMRDKKVQIVAIDGWENTFNLQYGTAQYDMAMHAAQSENNVIGWNTASATDSKASAWHVEYIGNSFDLAQLTDEYLAKGNELLNTYNNTPAYKIAAGLNNYSEATPGRFAAAKQGVLDVLTKLSTEEQIAAAKAELEAAIAALTINQPESGKFYRLRCVGTGMKYLQSTLEANRFKMISGDAGKTETATFCYYNGGLVAYTQPQYISHESNNASYSMTPLTVLFEQNNQNVAGQYNIKVGNRYLFGDGDLSDSGNGNPDAREGYRWWLEEVTTLPVAFGEAKAATLYAPVALTIPAGVKAYAGSVSGDYVVLTEVSTTIPANTGVILMAEEAKSYDFVVTTTENTVEGNVLTGTVATINTPANSYTLQAPDNVLKMKLYNGATLAGFKAYLSMTASPVQAFKLDLGEATGIESILNDANGKMVIYDMNGRRVQQMGKGLYIVNGKKVLVK